MKRVLILLLLIVSAISAFGQKSSKAEKLPSPEVLQAINDSILLEAQRLYIFEKLNWWATDAYYLRANDPNSTRDWSKARSVTVVANDKICVLFHRNDSCLLEYRYDMLLDETDIREEVRPLNQHEREIRDRHAALLDSCMNASLNIYRYDETKYAYNVDIIRVDEAITRVYFIMGALQNRCIGFGNDFSIDFDEENRIVATRSYHHSFIPQEWNAETREVTPMHSHTKDNPFMTPTDICTFMLYGYDSDENIDALWVYSSKYQTYFIFNAKNFEITSLTSEALQKIDKTEKKRHKK